MASQSTNIKVEVNLKEQAILFRVGEPAPNAETIEALNKLVVAYSNHVTDTSTKEGL